MGLNANDTIATRAPFGNGVFWIWSAEGLTGVRPAQRSQTYQVRRFRRSFTVEQPEQCRLVAHVSADSRYRFFINGQAVGRGPAKGDIAHQFYETYDLSDLLVEGQNVLCALVMDYSPIATHGGPHDGAPASVVTLGGGFVVDAELECPRHGEQQSHQYLSTDTRWKVAIDQAYDFHADGCSFGTVTGLMEKFFAEDAPAGWTQPAFDDSGWEQASCLPAAVRFEERRDSPSPYGLLPRQIPHLEEDKVKHFKSAWLPGGKQAPACWQALLEGKGACEVAAGERINILVDGGRLTTAYPMLALSGGKGSRVRLRYAEALRRGWDEQPPVPMVGRKVDLSTVSVGYADNEIGWTLDPRGTLDGLYDEIHLSGGRLEYEPFHWRTYQFIQLEIEVGEEPLIVESLRSRFTAYPMELLSSFDCSDARLTSMIEQSWHTLRLCTHETFEDCPYYEQLQYSGDTQITAQLMMLMSGDARLVRQAILHFDWSRLPEGITRSAYPNRIFNVIPSWSLQWIAMVDDYHTYTGDRELVDQVWLGMQMVIGWFRSQKDEYGLPAKLRYWNHCDWSPMWDRGQPPGWDEGATCAMSSQYLMALRRMERMARVLGIEEAAERYGNEVRQVSQAINERFWSEQEGLFYDRPGGPELSQFSNAWAIYAGVPTPEQKTVLKRRFPHDHQLAPAAFFGRYFVFRALRELDCYERMLDLLEPWQQMLETGLSTWAEDLTYWRSLCHAWSASPALELFREVLGIQIHGGGAKVVVAPQPCGLLWAQGSVPHAQGEISVHWQVDEGTMTLEATVPKGVELTLRSPGGECWEVPEGGKSGCLFALPKSELDLPLGKEASVS